jgi:hypothetical protein
VIGVVKAIFRTGRRWGSARTRVATARRAAPTVPSGAALAAGAVGGAAGAYFLDPQNGKRCRQVAVDRATLLVGNGAESTAPTKETVAAGS